MKKAISLLLAVLMLVGLFTLACAEDVEYEYKFIPELSMFIEVPTEMYCLFRDMDEEEPVLDLLGMSVEDVNNILVPGSAYLNAVMPDFSGEILVTMIDSMEIESLNVMSSAELKLGAAEMKKQYANMGVELLDWQTADINGLTYYIMHHSQQHENTAVSSLQYYTVYDYMAINVTFHSYDGPITNEDESMLARVIDSVEFSKGQPGLQWLYIDELDIVTAVPEDFNVLTRDMDEDDPTLAFYGLSAFDINTLLVPAHAYLDAIAPGADYEIMLVAVPSDSKDLNDMTSVEQKLLEKLLESQYKDMGMELISSQIYEVCDNKYVKSYTVQNLEGMEIYVLQYCTIINGMTYSFNLQSYAGEINEEMEVALYNAAYYAIF